MEYQEFKIRFAKGRSGEVEIHAESSYGYLDTVFAVPVKEHEAEDLLAAVDRCLRRSMSGDPPSAEPSSNIGNQEILQRLSDFGATLFNGLFQGELRRIYDRALGNAEGEHGLSPKTGLIIRLIFEGQGSDLNALASLPWELLLDPLNPHFLSRSRLTPIVRSLNVPRRIGKTLDIETLRVLLVASSPRDCPGLDLDSEIERIEKALGKIPNVEVSVATNRTIEQLHRTLLSTSCHIVHFMGHGDFCPATGEGRLFLVDERGEAAPIAGGALAEYLGDVGPIPLVVMNACNGATLPRRQGQDISSGVASALMRSGVPAIVAMQFPLTDEAAVLFATAFYKALSEDDPLEAAVSDARKALCHNDPTALEWITPVLFMRTQSRHLFRSIRPPQTPAAREGLGEGSEASKEETGREQTIERPAQPASETLPRTFQRLSIRSISGWGAPMDDLAHKYLNLTPFFQGRHIREPRNWNDAILPWLEDFLHQIQEGIPLHLHLAAHSSLAFAAGFHLEAKSGLEITLVQRSAQNRTEEWRSDQAPPGPDWQGHRDPIGFGADSAPLVSANSNDVAVALSATHLVAPDVRHFLKESGLLVRRILEVTASPRPGPHAVHSGLHAFELASSLVRVLRSRNADERGGTIHLFSAAPNALMFYLGQQWGGLGPVQLYEYDFESGLPGAYAPSILLG